MLALLLRSLQTLFHWSRSSATSQSTRTIRSQTPSPRILNRTTIILASRARACSAFLRCHTTPCDTMSDADRQSLVDHHTGSHHTMSDRDESSSTRTPGTYGKEEIARNKL